MVENPQIVWETRNITLPLVGFFLSRIDIQKIELITMQNLNYFYLVLLSSHVLQLLLHLTVCLVRY